MVLGLLQSKARPLLFSITGVAGVVQAPGVVCPTCVELLRQPLAASTLAKMVCAGPVWL